MPVDGFSDLCASHRYPERKAKPLTPAQGALLDAIRFTPGPRGDGSPAGGEVVVGPKNRTLAVLLRRGLVAYDPSTWVVTVA